MNFQVCHLCTCGPQTVQGKRAILFIGITCGLSVSDMNGVWVRRQLHLCMDTRHQPSHHFYYLDPPFHISSLLFPLFSNFSSPFPILFFFFCPFPSSPSGTICGWPVGPLSKIQRKLYSSTAGVQPGSTVSVQGRGKGLVRT